MTNGKKLVLGAVIGGVLLYLTRPKGTVTTSEEYDLGSVGQFDDKIKQMAQAIAYAEGFGVPGSVPQRANNPGDLKVGEPTLDGSGITLFESVDQGWNALYRQLALIVSGRSHYDLGDSIAVMGSRYAAGDANWARNVADFLGVSVSTPLYDVLI